jgi:hypothetical protein
VGIRLQEREVLQLMKRAGIGLAALAAGILIWGFSRRH